MGSLPATNATGEEIVAWFQANGASTRWSIWAGTVSAPLLALIAAKLRQELPKPHCDVFLIGSISLIVTVSAQSWILGGLALRADTVPPAVARTMLDTQ